MKYDFTSVEKEIQTYWAKEATWKANNTAKRPKRYILDMFPYPSGAGLHVGHLLGYFASDTLAIQSRMLGHEVLHPMGFDAFGLPAEQYAINTGQHPAITVKENIAAYKKVLKRAGLTFDWDREFSTTDPAYYRWTQWIFLQLFSSWYNKKTDQAESIESLCTHFATEGNRDIEAACHEDTPIFSAEMWQGMTPEKKAEILACYRLAYLSETAVNWCPGLGTVLANDEVEGGLSVRGGYRVEQKKMSQWSLRITAYADRLLAGLAGLDWSNALKETQRNWIGKSIGTTLTFQGTDEAFPFQIETFTTRTETLFGVTYLVLAPEHPLVTQMISWSPKIAQLAEQNPSLLAQINELKKHVAKSKNHSERERLQKANEIAGIFTGFCATHPLTGQPIPIWVGDYVLMTYGTGAVMGVPAHDERDYAFAKHFSLPIIPVISGGNVTEAAHVAKKGKLINSGFVNGLDIPTAQKTLVEHLEKEGKARATTHYRLRDAVFSRQRYWGEPFPIYYKNGTPHPISTEDLPLKLPAIQVYKPSPTGRPPLSRANDWTYKGHPIAEDTMPAWAGSSWYFLRYIDPKNNQAFVGKEAVTYWGAVDFYLGGKEHATGHLIYARFWTKFLHDLDFVPFSEPFKKLVNQGMIQSPSQFVYRIKGTNQFVSAGLKDHHETTPLRVSINLVQNGILNQAQFKKWRPDFTNATFILEDGHYHCGQAIEKMSKSKHNTIDPLPIIDRYGADALRLYLLFLGPIEQSKPWMLEGIEGVVRFTKKVWRLFHQPDGHFSPTDTPPSKPALQALHRAIKVVHTGIERFAFNTCVSGLMICVNKLLALQCTSKAILKDFIAILAPFAPHMAEHLWQLAHEKGSVTQAPFPTYNPIYLEEDQIAYPIAINGKVRAKLTSPSNATQATLQEQAPKAPGIPKWLQGKKIKKIIVVPKRMINIVV